jgi:predicted RNase H-like nuclease
MPPRGQRGAPLPYKLLAGVEPCPGGWLLVAGRLQGVTIVAQPPQMFTSFADILDWKPAFQVVAAHVPIGLLDKPRPGGRTCEREARRVIGFPRSGAIPSAPIRSVLGCKDYGEAYDVNEGLSPVMWGMVSHIAEIDRDFAPYWQRTVYEVHPELSFFNLNRDSPMRYTKNSPEGRKERRTILEDRIPGANKALNVRVKGARQSHLIDACAALWTARRVAAKAAARVPQDPEWDEQGLRMEIWR